MYKKVTVCSLYVTFLSSQYPFILRFQQFFMTQSFNNLYVQLWRTLEVNVHRG